MNYSQAITYLSDDDFESMVNSICQNILGFGTISFTKGRDGGKDGRFTGTANKFPSESKPWSGKMIIQAKHTGSPVASCSDGDFYSNKTSIVNKEIKRVNLIKKNEGLDCYLLFTNRKYTGGVDSEIINHISKETGIASSNIAIIGIETLNSLLNTNKSVVKAFRLTDYIIPFDFADDDLKLLISDFKQKLPEYKDQIGNEVETIKQEFNKITDSEKNQKNGLGEEYYNSSIQGESMVYFDKIDRFLGDPINENIKDVYYDIVSELRDLIVIKRQDFGAFEEIFVFIYKLVCAGNNELRGKKRFVNIFLHYMYHTCSIGLK